MQYSYLFLALLVISTRLQAQLPVDRETHHKVIMENAYFRLLEGKIPMGDTTPAHVHAANSVVIFLSHSTFGIQIIGDKPVIATLDPGAIRYLPYGDKPVNHIVWNQTPPLFHFYVVELAKNPVIKDSCPVLSNPGLALQFQQPRVKAYSLDLAGNQTLHLEPTPCARLLVDVTGTYKFFPPNTPLDLKSAGHFILLDIN